MLGIWTQYYNFVAQVKIQKRVGCTGESARGGSLAHCMGVFPVVRSDWAGYILLGAEKAEKKPDWRHMWAIDRTAKNYPP